MIVKAIWKGFLKERVSHRVKLIGGVLVSIASAGAVLGGLTGYWNAWKTVKTELSQERPNRLRGKAIIRRIRRW